MIGLTVQAVPATAYSALQVDCSDDGVKTCDGEDQMRVAFGRRDQTLGSSSQDHDDSRVES